TCRPSSSRRGSTLSSRATKPWSEPNDQSLHQTQGGSEDSIDDYQLSRGPRNRFESILDGRDRQAALHQSLHEAQHGPALRQRVGHTRGRRNDELGPVLVRGALSLAYETLFLLADTDHVVSRLRKR